MAREEKKDDAPSGAFPVKGHRKPRPGEVVAERVAKLCKQAPEPRCIEQNDVEPKRVQPLAGGFFALERLRATSVERKKRTKKRGKMRTR